MPTKYNPSDFENELEYVEAEIEFKLQEGEYELNEDGKLLKLDLKYSDFEYGSIDFLLNLSSISSLNLSQCGIGNRLSVIAKLSFLKKLDISNNNISDIYFLTKLVSLEEINISSNLIDNIDVLSDLSNLESINISNNPIPPKAVYNLPNLASLKKLYVAKLRLKSINFLKTSRKLIELGIAENPISDISVLKTLSNLHYLHIAEIPEVQDFTPICNLLSLEHLSIRDNSVVDISVLEKLSSLKFLSASNIGIKNISVLSKLTSLERLYLQENSIEDISPISNLTSLKVLNLSNNLIKFVPDLYALTSLTGLYLGGNQIIDISGLSSLTKLTRLSLSTNLLSDIRPLSKLTSLVSLNLKGNQIKSVPETILNSSTQEIVRWLQETEKRGGKVLLNDIKVLLLGNTNIGKSNLLSYWEQWYTKQKITKVYPKESDSTHGLVYEELQRDNNGPVLHIWDFGGQEYFHATHQLFFSPDALHVLLWAKGELVTRKENEKVFELDYWLRCSEQLSKDESPIEMVLIENKIDHQDENAFVEFYSHFPENKYLEKFNIYSPHKKKDTTKPPIMLNTCSVSLLHLKRLQGMFELLEERIEMLHQKNLHPPKYAEIRDALDKSKRKYWTLNQYKKRFEEEDGIILQTLHRLGCLLYFHEQLPNKIFTQPELLLNLIYSEILNEDLQKNHGKISNELETAAKNKDLKLKEEELKTLLSAFKLIFQTQDGSWYAPQYLPEESPAWLRILRQHTFGYPNIIVSSDQYLMNSILLDIFSEYAKVIKKDNSYLFWQKGLVIEKDGQLLLVEYDRQQMRLLLYGDQQGTNTTLQKEVVDFIHKIIEKPERERYEETSEHDEIHLKGKRSDVNPTDWNSSKVKVGVSIDGTYYVNVKKLNANVANEIYTIRAFAYDDSSIQKTFSVFQFNQYLVNQYKGTLKKVAISYSKDDLKLVNEFIKNLVPLQDDGLIASPVWYCTDLEAGAEWNNEIQENFAAADIIFFMISPSSLANSYIKEYEIKTAIRKYNDQKEKKVPVSERLRIIPIRLEYGNWTRKDASINLSQFQALPYRAKPVSSYENRNEAWYLVTENIRMAIENEFKPNSFKTSKEIKGLQERQVEAR